MLSSNIAKFICLLGVWLLLICIPASAKPFNIESADVINIGNGHALNATIRYPLTPRVKEALNNGVPITFYQELELLTSTPLLGDYWQWESKIWSTEIRYQLSYHALTQQYLLIDLDTKYQRNFSSLAGALTQLGMIKNLTLPPSYLTENHNLILRLRSGLDLNALPTPMRPGALISSKWQLTSPWFTAKWL